MRPTGEQRSAIHRAAIHRARAAAKIERRAARPRERAGAKAQQRRARPGLGEVRIGVILALVLVVARAGATGPTAAAREASALFYEARTLMAQGQYGAACPKLERSLAIDPGIGTRFNLANCNEHIGKTASAFADFGEVARLAHEAGQDDRARIAAQRAQALEGRLAKLVIVAAADAPSDLEIRRDGIVVPRPAWGTALPVDPGAHTLTATSRDAVPWETSVLAIEARTTTANVPPMQVRTAATTTGLPDDEPSRDPSMHAANVGDPSATPDLVPPVPSTSTTETTLASMPVTFPPPVVETRGGTQRAIGYVLGGAGLLSLGVAAGFGLHSLDKRDDARGHCVGNTCDAAGVSLRDDARTAGNISTITAVGGGVALVTGVVLVLTAKRSEPASTAYGPGGTWNLASLVPGIDVRSRSVGLTLRGALP